LVFAEEVPLANTEQTQTREKKKKTKTTIHEAQRGALRRGPQEVAAGGKNRLPGGLVGFMSGLGLRGRFLFQPCSTSLCNDFSLEDLDFTLDVTRCLLVVPGLKCIDELVICLVSFIEVARPAVQLFHTLG